MDNVMASKNNECERKDRFWEENAFKKINRILSEITDSSGPSSVDNDKKLRLEESDRFFERLQTFNSFSWSLKPLSVAPPVCARLGWIVIKPHILKCIGCNKILSAELPPVWKIDCYNAGVAKLEIALKEAHEKFCPWPLKNCPENYLSETLLHRDKCIDDFKGRLQTFTTETSKLPNMAKDTPDDLKLCCNKLFSANSSVIKSPDDVMRYSNEAIALALTGWLNITFNGLAKLKCGHCLRITDASLFTEKQENVKDESALEEPEIKKTYSYLPTLFHPLNEHHKWCPWVSVTSGDELNKRPCWMVLCNTIVSHDQLIPESPRNVVLKVKKIMSQWIK